MLQHEEDLVRRAQDGDGDAIAKLFEANFDKVYRYVAFKVGNRADAEDLTQQTFLSALKSIAGYRWQGLPFSAWLFRIAKNQTADHFRRMGKEQRAALDESMAAPSADPALIAERRLTVSEMVEACRQLTEAQREVIYLRFGGELSIAETAKVLRKSEGSVKVMQHDAVAKLRRILSRGDSGG